MSATEPIHILHVDDDPDFAGPAAAFLERGDDRFEVGTATSASEGLDRIADDIQWFVEHGRDLVVRSRDEESLMGFI